MLAALRQAADDAVITRELTQAVAFRLGSRVSLSPLPAPGAASNGTHIHWSFLDDDDRPVPYDEGRPMNLSLQGSQFVAGVLHHLPALRLRPAASPDPARRARQFNVEFRVADATASPCLALAVLVQAGLDGIRRRLPLDAHRPQPLPDNLGHALDLLESSAAAECLGADVLAAYVRFKRAEIAGLDDVDEGEICRRYAEVY